MITWPLDNIEYTASAIGAYCASRTRGVFATDSNFSTSAIGGFNLQISEGLAWLKKDKFWGVAVLNSEDIVLSADIGSGLANRYVSVVLQLDKTANETNIVLKYSTYGQEALPPVRDEFYDEIILCHAVQRAGASEFTSADITDTRTNEDLCGVVSDGITGIPTDVINNQFKAKMQLLDEELQSVEDRSGLMLNAVYDPLNSGINITKQQYQHSALSTLIGQGANGFFVADFSGTVNEFTINDENYSVKNGNLNEVILEEGMVYNFIEIDGMLYFITDANAATIAQVQTAQTTANAAMPKTGGTFTGAVSVPSTATNYAGLVRNIYPQSAAGAAVNGTQHYIFRRK